MSAPMKKAKVIPKEDLEVRENQIMDSPVPLVREYRNILKQIWINVFNKLDERDKPAFSQANAEWHSWTKGKRAHFLLQEVAPVLFETLPKKDFLQNRKYCKSWVNAVDNLRISPFTIRFSSNEDVQKFMDEMRTHSGNPFVGRSICFSWWKPLNEELEREPLKRLCREYWANVILLLQTFGTELQFVRFGSYHSEVLEIEYDHILRDCLWLLPNLKGLDMYRCSNVQENELLEFYRPGLLPQLEHLVTLKSEHVGNQLMEALLGSCSPSKLKKLTLSGGSSPHRLLLLQRLTSLETLSGWLSLEELEGISNLPLKRLSLNSDASFQQLFTALAAFGETLVELYFHSTLEDFGCAENFNVNLPKLEELEIYEYSGPLDPFVHLTSLRELEISNYHENEEQGQNELVQVFGFRGRMDKSNIWRLMPSLQKLKILEYESYWRDEKYFEIIHGQFY